jgi:hypothetical protein
LRETLSDDKLKYGCHPCRKRYLKPLLDPLEVKRNEVLLDSSDDE